MAAPVAHVVSVPIGLGRRRVAGRVLGAGRCLGRAWLEAQVAGRAPSAWHRRTRGARFAAALLDALAIGVVRRGRPGVPDGATLVVANHVAWLDACVLQAVLPARLVLPAALARLPVVGTLARRFDAIVVGANVRRAVDEIAAALRAGERVVVFPERTPTDGRSVAPFAATLLEAAVETGAPVLPVALRWLGLGGRPTSAVARRAEPRPGASLLGVLNAPYLRAEVRVATPLSVANRSRRALAMLARASIAESLGLPT